MAPRSASVDWFGDQRPPHSPADSPGGHPAATTAERAALFDRPFGRSSAPGRELAATRQGVIDDPPYPREHQPVPEPPVSYREEDSRAVAIRFERDLTVAGAGTTVARRPEYPRRKLLAVALFWVMLLVSVSLWWFNTPAAAVRGHTGVVLAAGRITGLMAGFILLVEILSMARLRWIESWFGSYELLNWHRALGGALVVLTFGHAILLFVAYSWATKSDLLFEAWTMITTMRGMISATAAAVVILLAGLLSARLIRRALPYELWRVIHMSFYLVVFLAYGHQFALGTAVIRPGLARWYWIALHLLVGACLLWGRVLRPVWYNMRHEFSVIDVIEEIPGWVSIYIGGRRMDWAHAEAGQYVRCRFLAPGCWWQSHPFSVSAAPNGEWLRISVKAVGQYTKRLQRLDPGVGVLLSEPSGSCTASRRVKEKALIITGSTGIAGSAGIAPVVPLIGELPEGTTLLYRAHSERDLVFREELERLVHECDGKLYFIIGADDDHWPQRAFSPVGLRELVPDIADRDVFVCAPRWLAKQSLTALRLLGVPSRQIHLDSNEF